MKSRISLIPRIILFVCIFSAAFPVYAATSKLSCELTIATENGSVTTNDTETVLLQKGETVEFSWKSTNAKKAFDDDGKKIPSSGTATTSLTKSATLSYQFENGNKKTECTVVAKIVSGSFNESTLDTTSLKPSLSGKVTGVKSVRFEVYKEDSKKLLFTSKTIKVKNGVWKGNITKTLSKGTYDVVLIDGDKKIELNTIATDTLTVGSKKKVTTSVTSETTFYAESVPLLNGGIAKAGMSVPIAYLQVINIGKSAGVVENFTVKQTGSASTQAVVGFSVSDSTSSTVYTEGSVLKPIVFKNGVAIIPVSISMKAGESKLVTLKAIMAPNLTTQINKQLKFDVIGIDTNAIQKATFPIRGVTWMLGL